MTRELRKSGQRWRKASSNSPLADTLGFLILTLNVALERASLLLDPEFFGGCDRPTSGTPREQSIVSPARNSLDDENDASQSGRTQRMDQLAAKRPSFKICGVTRLTFLVSALAGSLEIAATDTDYETFMLIDPADFGGPVLVGPIWRIAAGAGLAAVSADLAKCLDAVFTGSKLRIRDCPCIRRTPLKRKPKFRRNATFQVLN